MPLQLDGEMQDGRLPSSGSKQQPSTCGASSVIGAPWGQGGRAQEEPLLVGGAEVQHHLPHRRRQRVVVRRRPGVGHQVAAARNQVRARSALYRPGCVEVPAAVGEAAGSAGS